MSTAEQRAEFHARLRKEAIAGGFLTILGFIVKPKIGVVALCCCSAVVLTDLTLEGLIRACNYEHMI